MFNMKRMLGSRAALTLGTWVAYVLTFILLYRMVGAAMAALAMLPVVMTGWSFGMQAGLLTGLLTFPLNMLLMTLVTGTARGMITTGGVVGTVLILLTGAVVGRLYDLGEQMKRELAERKRAEGALQELMKKTEQAKEEWESTADSLPELICLIDDRGRIIRANRTVETWNLGRVVDVRGRGVHELLHPGCAGVSCRLGSRWKQAWEETMQGQPAECEVYDEVLKRHVLIRVQPWKGEAIGSTVVVVQDITEHKQAEEALKEYSERLEEMVEERTAALKAINEQLRLEITERQQAEEALKRRMEYLAALSQASQAVTASLELDQVLAEIVSLAGGVVASDYTTVVLMDEAGHMGQSAENLPGVPAMEYRVREEGLTTWIVRSHQAVIIGEIGEDGAISPDLGEGAPRFVNRPTVEAGIKSGAGLPLMVKGRLLGVLYLHSMRPHALDGQLPLLTTFANQVAIAIENARLYATAQQELAERKRAEEALRDEKALMDALMDNITDSIYFKDRQCCLTRISRKMMRDLNLDEMSQAIGKTDVDLFGEEFGRKTLAEDQRIIATGEPIMGLIESRQLEDGQINWTLTTKVPLRDASGQIMGLAGITREINELMRAEQSLRESEEKYRTILENIEDGYYEVDLAGNLTFFNDSLCRLYGYSEDELMGMNYRQYMDDGTAKVAHQTFNEVYRTGNPAKAFDWEVIRKGRARRFVEASVTLMTDSAGEPVGFRGIVRDITERKRAEREIEERRVYLEGVLRAAPDAIVALDARHRVMEWNLGAQKLFGYSREEVVGRDIDDLVTKPDVLEEAVGFTQTVMGGGEIPPVETVRYRKDSSPVDVIVAGSPMLAGGEFIGAVAVYTDITERKRAEEAIHRYVDIVNNMQLGLQVYQLEVPEDDRTLRMIGTNPAAAQFTGQMVEDVLGKTLDEILPWLRKVGLPQTYADVVRTGIPVELEQEVYYDEDRIADAWWSIKAFPLPGHCVGVLFEDITLQKQAEESLRQSRIRYRAMLEDQTELICRFLPDGTLVFVNEACRRYFGQQPSALIGQSYVLLTLEEDQTRVREHLISLNLENPVVTYECRAIRSDGETRWLRWTGRAIFDEQDHRLIEFQSVGRDVTERRRAEEALRVSEERFALAVQGSNDGIWDWDIQNNSLYWSPRLKELLGYAGDELDVDFDTFDSLLHPDDREHMGPAIGAHLKDRGLYDVEQRLRTKSGEYRWFHARGQALWDEAGQPLRMVGSTADITERKRAEEQLERYAVELEQANEEVKQFAYIVSHDLRAPLVNLKGFSAELRFALETIDSAMAVALPHLEERQGQDVTLALEEDIPEALGFIDSSVSHMDHFINALLKLSRLGRRELHLEPVDDLEALVQATLESLAHQIEERQVEVRVGTLPEVVADRTSMEQIMGNLLGNAVKYLEPDRPGEIEITAERRSDETLFCIRDNGRGIAEEDMPKVFAPFRRIGRQDMPGEGMGLPYVQALVRRHGGRIWCESELGVGTTFSFTISSHLA